MLKCSNCGEELDEGAKFCMYCGAPVPQVKKCPQCGMELPLKARFCFGCGFKLEGSATSTSGISMGDKNVVAGDVVGTKVAGDNVQSKIMGNAIYNTYQDESKKILSCSICGKHLTNDSAYTCPKCGKVVCAEHFDAGYACCISCRDVVVAVNLAEFKNILVQVLNGSQIIDQRGRQILNEAAQRLHLSKEMAEGIINETLQQADDTFNAFEQKRFSQGKGDFMLGNAENAYAKIKPIFEKHPNNSEVLTWILRILKDINLAEAYDIASKMNFQNSDSCAVMIEYETKNGNFAEAATLIERAKKSWPQNAAILQAEVHWGIALFKADGDRDLLEEILESTNKIDTTQMSDFESDALVCSKLAAGLCLSKKDLPSAQSLKTAYWRKRISIVPANKAVRLYKGK